MSKTEKLIFCELPETPREFDIKKFKDGDPEQKALYSKSKAPRRRKTLTYDEVMDEDKWPNYARVVPKDCVFIDFDDPKEAEEMYDIITRAKLNCLILETTKGYHFMFRKPDFYKKEMTRATNWFGYKFDTKGPGAVQILRVCGMDREERCSWALGELVAPASIDIDKLDILPYWLWGKLSEKDLHKKGKPGESEYHLDDTPFTQLMKMGEGGRHNHIVECCSYFALSNGFKMGEFKELITAIHDQYLVKLGTPMPDSDLFGDLPERWADYEALLTSEGWLYEERERKWKKVKEKKEEKIDERRAAEYLFEQFDFYGKNLQENGTFKNLIYREKDGDYNYQTDLTKVRHTLKLHSDQNFKETYFKEVEVQLMQMCAENEKLIKRSHQYVIAKNRVLSCITADTYDFSWLDIRPPTDVVFKWTWHSKEWVEEHKEDLGGLITQFIKDLSRNAKGEYQEEVEQWLWVIAGASMIPCNELEKIIVMAGGGQNGKSIYTSLIRLCLGEDMFNTSKVFDSNPQTDFWGKDLDKGICCIVDDLPPHYKKEAFSYLKGAITRTDTVEINEKFKNKRRLDVLPQIIACTNHDFKLHDTSEGMKRRVKILPTEFHIDDSIKDLDLQHKLVLNTTNLLKIKEYKIADNFVSEDHGELCMNMYTKEKGVLDSLNGGSLAWFANKARYMYFKWLMKELILEDSEGMKTLCENAFKSEFEIQCENFIKWHLEKHEGTKANCFFGQLRKEYEEEFCEEAEIVEIMTEKQFNKYCGSVIKKLEYKTTKRRNDNNIPSTFYLFVPEE
ncbi:MAG: hypothetical protein HFJ29_00825 [Clostridia bacterium]|nr:hypothetical protein [Clostridia bacterium]